MPYLLIFTTLLRLLQHYGWQMLPLVQSAEPAAYMLLVSWWAYAAWEPETAPDVSPVNGCCNRGALARSDGGLQVQRAYKAVRRRRAHRIARGLWDTVRPHVGLWRR